jgi:hypothetical protein
VNEAKKQVGDVTPETFLIARVAAKIFDGADAEQVIDALAGLIWLCLDEPRFTTPETRRRALDRIHGDVLAILNAWDKARAKEQAMNAGRNRLRNKRNQHQRNQPLTP